MDLRSPFPRRLAPLAPLALLALAACGATPNPPRPAQPRAEAGPSSPAPGPTAAADGSRPAEHSGGAPQTAPESMPGKGPTGGPTGGQQAASAPAGPDLSEPAVARVAGRPIGVRELVLHWLQQSPREVRAALEQLVDSHLVAAEAGRLGIRLEPEAVERLYRETLGDLQDNVERTFPGKTLDEWIVTRLGLAPEFYLDGARADVIRHLLAERAVRAFTLANERAIVRAVVTGERAQAEEALARAQSGEDFAEIARELSQDPSAERGGLLPPILRSGSSLSRLAFGTGAGGLGGPIQEQDAWLVMRVESIDPPVRGRWEAVRDLVEDSLLQRPVQDAEYWQWRVEMLERHDVDLGPFLELTGRPRSPRGGELER